MLVMLTEGLSVSGRGQLRRWLQEFKPGVFLGYANALVRDELWVMLEEKHPSVGVLQIWPGSNEQRLQVRIRNFEGVSMTDLDGLQFVTLQDAAWKDACKRFFVGCQT
jgi:CRISPR-associated endoribonuclease Cas2 subtype I-E